MFYIHINPSGFFIKQIPDFNKSLKKVRGSRAPFMLISEPAKLKTGILLYYHFD